MRNNIPVVERLRLCSIYDNLFVLLFVLLFIALVNTVLSGENIVANNVLKLQEPKKNAMMTTCQFHYTTPIIERPQILNNNHSTFIDDYTITNTTINNTCYFLELPFSEHFPHALQQLLRCWSYWQENKISSTKNYQHKPPVLLFNTNTNAYRKRGFWDRTVRSPKFLLGFLWDLERLGIFIRKKKTDANTNKTSVVKPPYQVRTPADTLLLAKSIRKLHSIPERSSCYNSKPIIGIVNRDPSTSLRSLLNMNEILNVLQHEQQHYTIKTSYFENKSFVNQVKFLSSIDLLVTPHGAQCTGMIFMGGGKCGGIMEIFPEGYYLPYFFGSLADATGIRHYSLYQSNNTVAIPTKSFRNMSRDVNLCPNLNTVLDGIEKMVSDWHECCNI